MIDRLTDNDISNSVAEINGFSDGESRFVRINSVLLHICSILGSPANKISLSVMDKCLSNPSGRGKEPSWETISDFTVENFKTGRWSPHLSILDIAYMSFSMDEMCDCNGIVLDWIESKVSSVIRNLEKGRMFFPFKMKVGRVSVWIETYNRYLLTNGYLWKQTSEGQKRGSKSFVSKNYVYQLPIVPQHLVSLTTPHSVFNAIYRMRNKLHGQLKHLAGWGTLEDVDEHIKVAYCSDFLKSLIDQTDDSVKKHFISYEASGLEPIVYIKMIHNIAKSLSPFQGVEITKETVVGLRLPARYLLNIKEIIRRNNSAHLQSFIRPKNALEAPLDYIDKGALGAPIMGVSGALGAPTVGGQGALGAQIRGSKNTSNSLNTNELDNNSDLPSITPIIKNTNCIEDKENKSMNEPSNIRTDVKTLSLNDMSYNDDMNEELQDKSMNEEQLSEFAFSNPAFVPVDGLDAKLIIERYHPKVVKELTEEDRRKKVEQKLMAKIKIRPTTEHKTILNDSRMFMTDYKRIFQEHSPAAKFSPTKDYRIDNLSHIKIVLDKLYQCGTLDIDVLHSWMHHTAEAFKRRVGYITVSLMEKTWDSFSRQMISTEVVNNKKQTKIAVKEAIKRDTIGESMSSYFEAGLTPMAAYKACRYWGVVLTAQYLASKGSSEDAVSTIEAALSGQYHGDLADIFASTVKYEVGTSGMILSDWRVRLASFVAKAGKLEALRIQGSEKEWCDKFISGFSRRP